MNHSSNFDLSLTQKMHSMLACNSNLYVLLKYLSVNVRLNIFARFHRKNETLQFQRLSEMYTADVEQCCESKKAQFTYNLPVIDP